MADFDFEQLKKDILDGVSNAADAVSNVAKETSGDVTRFKHFNETGRDLFASGAVTSHGGNLSVSDGVSIWISRTGAMLGHLMPGDVLRVDWQPTPTDANASMELVVHRAMYKAYAECVARANAAVGAAADGGAGAGADAGTNTDTNVGTGASTGANAGAGTDVNVNVGVGAGVKVNVGVNTGTGASVGASTGAGLPFGMHAIVHAHTKYTVFRSLVDDFIEPVDSEGKLLLGAKVPVLTPEETVASEEVAALMAEQVASGVAVAVVRGHGPFAWADSLENAFRLISCLEYSAEVLTLFEMTKRKLK